MGKSGLLGNWEIINNISEEIKSKLDSDVQDVLSTCLKEVIALLKKEEPLMDRLAQELVAKSELNYDEIEAIFKEFGKSRP
jgi:ATP-dependent Zn protease